jgi:outer membrane protein assembly factor BamB
VADGTVYVGDLENRIYGYDTADGSERWQFETGDDVRSSPAVVDGTLYVGSDDGNLYALRDR